MPCSEISDDLGPTVETRGRTGHGLGRDVDTFEAHEAAGPFVEIGRDSTQRNVVLVPGTNKAQVPAHTLAPSSAVVAPRSR
jgi:hypothetical protein